MPKRQASMIRPHAQDESTHALHAKARARMLMLAQGCESSRLLLSRVCGDMIGVSIRAHQYKKAVTHHMMMMAHQYKLALQRQVLRIGGTKNWVQQYKLALRQRVIQFNTCYSNVNETSQDASYKIVV